MRATLLCFAFAAAYAEPAAEATEPEPAVPLRIGLEWFLNPDHLPLVVAQKEGYFADAGLAVELVEPADHWEAEKEILEGRLDVAVTETLHLAQDAAKGKPVIGFARILHTDGGVMYLKNKNITRPRDMCGATISYPGYPGPGGPAIVGTMIEADGGACDRPFGKHDGSFYHTDSLASGNADVATLVFYNFEMVEAKARGLDAGFFSLKDYGVPDFCQLVLFTTPAKLEAAKPELRALVKAVRRAVGLVKTDPRRARAIWETHTAPKRGLLGKLNPFTWAARAKEAKVNRATLDATLPAFVNDGFLAKEYYDDMMAWLVKTGQVEASEVVPTSTYWTNDLVRAGGAAPESPPAPDLEELAASYLFKLYLRNTNEELALRVMSVAEGVVLDETLAPGEGKHYWWKHHGFRAGLGDWIVEVTPFPTDAGELALSFRNLAAGPVSLEMHDAGFTTIAPGAAEGYAAGDGDHFWVTDESGAGRFGVAAFPADGA